jgi:uncharacterized protein (DUF305 family)
MRAISPFFCRVRPAVVAVILAGAAACGGAARGAGSNAEADAENAARAEALRSRNQAGYRHTEADVHFMSGMIPHHAQAIVMAQYAETRSSSRSVKILAERIHVSQRDEIKMMQQWLRDRRLPVPDSNATHLRMNMGGMTHDMLMPGMLSDEELTRLRNASGSAFDRLFLTFMIRHHQGAITMVEELFNSPGAGQEEAVFKFASDVFADQTAEIDRMERMLATIPPG